MLMLSPDFAPLQSMPPVVEGGAVGAGALVATGALVGATVVAGWQAGDDDHI
jgi:hypothetical protein